MEHTGVYWYPIARALNEAGFFVSIVNAILIHDFSDNSLRKVKTDRADAMKIANYGLSFWNSLRRFVPDDEIRTMLKAQSRLYERTSHVSIVMRNGLVTLTEQTFPGINKLLPSTTRTASGHFKWVDFCKRFWHRDCVAGVSLKAFAETYYTWCRREGYNYSDADAAKIHRAAREVTAILPKCESTKRLVVQSVDMLNAAYDSLQAIRTMKGIGETLAPRFIAEIGDPRRFHSAKALIAYAGIDAPPYQSGQFTGTKRHISKRGSPHLRKVAFLTCSAILRNGNLEDPIFAFMDKKRNEGKHYYVYMVAGAAKLLRIYFARVNECFLKEEALTEVP